MAAVVDRIHERSIKRVEDSKESYISVYEVIEKVSNEVIKKNENLISEITLGNYPEGALETVIIKTINKYNFKVLDKSREDLKKEVLDYVFRYGPIQKLLDIPNCNGVFINGPDNVWAKIGRKMNPIKEINFGNTKNITNFIYTSIKAKLRGEINENIPLATFNDQKNKLRIICAISPMAHISPTVIIRKHSEEGFTMEDLVEMGMMTKELADDLVRYNNAGANIIICGSGGAGKTTLIRALTEEVSPEERILAMEETAEFFLKHPNAVQLLVKRGENGKVINFEEIAEKGLLMSIIRYIFGEIRAGEAMSFFYGAFSGNITMTSLHANSAREALLKAMIMMKMSGTDIDRQTLMDMLYSSTNIIVFLDSFVAIEVVEVVKTKEGAEYNDLWTFDISHREATFIEGEHRRVNKIRSEAMIRKLKAKGLLKEGEGVDAGTC